MTFRASCRLYPLFVLVACGEGVLSHPGGAPDGATDGGAVDPPVGDETQPLGMNDVSLIVPSLFTGGELFGRMDGVTTVQRDIVPRDLFERIVTAHGEIQRAYNDFVLFAIRFDLCDRVEVGPCPIGADGSLRLVLQAQELDPVNDGASDVALHAFYPIPAADLGYLVNELRAIARLSDTGALVAGPLIDNHFPSTAGIDRLKDLVVRYAAPDHLIRLALMGQDARSTMPRVVFRMIELQHGEMVDLQIPTLSATEQVVAVSETDGSYAVTPFADKPTGAALALSSSSAFAAATTATQRTAVDAMVAADNPTLHTPHSVQCAACHTSTYVVPHRPIAGVNVRDLPSFFATARDARVSIGSAPTDQRTLHAFGWIGRQLSVSQRVANETAVVLDEIEKRFPPRMRP